MKDFSNGIRKNNDRARSKGLEGNLTVEEFRIIADLFKEDGELVCPYCNRKGADSLDHIIPLNKGGGTTKKNIIPVHVKCNMDKSSEDVHTFEKNCKATKINCKKIEMVMKNDYHEKTTYLKFTKDDWELQEEL